ncbi:MAG: class I SAM-dependent methyltransferase [Flammeovirgaceae bacterium]
MDWNANLYNTSHAFVYGYGASLIELLNPQVGEMILDIGCGSGQLTKEIADAGAVAFGIDASEAMIDDAKTRYPALDFQVMDGQALDFPLAFDAIFSNAAFHWMPNQEALTAGIVKHLKPGGRLVVEFGGKANVLAIRTALKAAFEKRGLAFHEFWYFPSIATYSTLLEKFGLTVTYAQYYNRDTPLEGDGGMLHWLQMFGAVFFQEVNNQETKQAIIREAIEGLRPDFYTSNGWIADYKRIRIVAKKE